MRNILWHGASVDIGRDVFIYFLIFWRQKRREKRRMLFTQRQPEEKWIWRRSVIGDELFV